MRHRLIFLLLAGLMSCAAVAGPQHDPPPALGRTLTGAELFDLSGARYRIDDVTSERMVVIFWAFWCDTWKKALPAVQELTARQDEFGCRVWTVSVDGRYTDEIRPLVKAGKIPFPVLLDDETLSHALGIRRVPTVLVLNRERKVVWAYEAYPGNDRIEQALHAIQ